MADNIIEFPSIDGGRHQITPISSEEIFETFKESYPDLKKRKEGPNRYQISIDTLTDKDKERILLDIHFFTQNPQLPLENLCNQMRNYIPKNESQKEMVDWAYKFLAIEKSTTAAGLFMYGDTGIGKTHISVALTKESLRLGKPAYFASAEFLGPDLNARSLGPGQVRVIDDLTTDVMAIFHFKKIVLNAHNVGGKMFVTSNTPYDQILKAIKTSRYDEGPKYMDRMKGMFKELKVEGESQRSTDTWYQKLE